MFDFGYGELLVIGIAALIFIGPKELPGVLRTLGQWMGKVRRMAGEFQNQFHEAMREAELADLKKEVDEMAAQAAKYNFDPLAEVRKEMDVAQRDVESSLADKPAAAAGGPAEAGLTTPAPDSDGSAANQSSSAGEASAPSAAGTAGEALGDTAKEPEPQGADRSAPV